MKTFNNFKNAFNWVNTTVKTTTTKSKEDIAREVYKDSEEFIFIDNLDMYKSGSESDFEKGIVLIKAPQVRRLYYVHGLKPHKNKKARRLWFEVVKNKHMNKYKEIYIKSFNSMKGS